METNSAFPTYTSLTPAQWAHHTASYALRQINHSNNIQKQQQQQQQQPDQAEQAHRLAKMFKQEEGRYRGDWGKGETKVKDKEKAVKKKKELGVEQGQTVKIKKEVEESATVGLWEKPLNE